MKREVKPSQLASGVELKTGQPVELVIPAWKDEQGNIDFVLYTEVGVTTLKARFTVEGHGQHIAGETGQDGRFQHGPVDLGDYELAVGDASFTVPACRKGTPPHAVHVMHRAIPESRDAWQGPTPEEQSEMQDEPAGSAGGGT